MGKNKKSRRELLYDKIAKREISRILKELSIPDSHMDNIFEKYLQIHSNMNPERRYHDPETLVPLIIYFYCKVHGIPINSLDLIDHSKLTMQLFKIFMVGILSFNFDALDSPEKGLGLSTQDFKTLIEKNNDSQNPQKKRDNNSHD
ncbi:hypothetical protein ES705_22550 [subsurface metagenome]